MTVINKSPYPSLPKLSSTYGTKPSTACSPNTSSSIANQGQSGSSSFTPAASKPPPVVLLPPAVMP